MKFMKVVVSSLLMLSSLAFAGESGYLLNGKAIPVFKDGKKVGKMPEHKQARTPSSMVHTGSYDSIYYEDDGNIRCYTISIPSQSTAISCVTKTSNK